MISFTLIILAAICNSVMDTLVHHYYISVFYKDNSKYNIFLNPEISSEFAYILPFTKYKLDAWHTFKSLMIILFALAIVFYKQVFNWYTDFIIIGIIWNSIFNLFYNKILLK